MLLISPLPRGRWTFSVRAWLAFVALVALTLLPARYVERDRRIRQLVAARDAALRDWRHVKRQVDHGIGPTDDEVQARERYFHAREVVEDAVSRTVP